MKNDGGPAFPQTVSHSPLGDREFPGEYGLGGMSLRDWFAGIALQGLLSSETPSYGYATKEIAIKDAYEIADIMIKERENDSTS